jgi:patatin-like phospholipase/acyl hydrolase
MTLEERIKSPRPKKILALDGGGIRGMLTLEILAKIESVLRAALGRDDSFVLADYFDFISGTSTGAIIAAGLAMGRSVAEMRNFYLENGKTMFEKAAVLKRLHHLYEDEKLRAKLKEVYGEDTTLGSDRIKTLLMMVMRNATTDSPWPVSNNPYAKFNDRSLPDCNLDVPLWQLVRASTAAPVFFPPETVQIGAQKFVFVDGGITPFNNPAFQSFLMATVEPYHVNWRTGENKMLLVSVGTGASPYVNANLEAADMNLVHNVTAIPNALMFAALNEQDTLCRIFGKCLAGPKIDSEIGDLIGSKGPVQPKLFTYLRYNAELTRRGLDDLGLSDVNPENVQKLDSVEFIPELQRVGRAVAEREVRKENFAEFLQ